MPEERHQPQTKAHYSLTGLSHALRACTTPKSGENVRIPVCLVQYAPRHLFSMYMKYSVRYATGNELSSFSQPSSTQPLSTSFWRAVGTIVMTEMEHSLPTSAYWARFLNRVIFFSAATSEEAGACHRTQVYGNTPKTTNWRSLEPSEVWRLPPVARHLWRFACSHYPWCARIG